MNTIYAAPGTSYESALDGAPTGLVGTIGVRTLDGVGGVTQARSTAGIVETPAGSGTYVATRTSPNTAGQYVVLWDTDPGGVANPANSAADQLVVTSSIVTPGVPPAGGGPALGPCSPWILGVDVTCSTAVTDRQAAEASAILYELSGRQFGGVCQKTIRPCRTLLCDTWQGAWRLGLGPSYAWGWIGAAYGWIGAEGPAPCGCSGLNVIPLTYPVKAVQTVKVNGAVVNPAFYRVDEYRDLVSLDDTSSGTAVPRPWPGCQNLALDDTQVGTWSVTYTYGADVPDLAKDAAKALACQLALVGTASCQLPSGVTKVTRQGVVIERAPFFTWMRQADGSRRTGIPIVDAFLATYNPRGLRRRPAVYSPDVQQLGRRTNT